MALTHTLPIRATNKDQSVKDLIFTILTKEYPLKLIELTNLIKKRYGKSVTFQAVRKATLELKAQNVIEQTDKSFQIRKEWVLESKQFYDRLSTELISEKRKKSASVDSINQDISVFTFNSLNELMIFWEQIIDDWFDSFKKGDYNINCWQGAHAWEILLHADREKRMMARLKNKGIKSYVLNTMNTMLDKTALKFYSKIGVQTTVSTSHTNFDKEYYFGTYGATVVQVHYPPKLVSELDAFFKATKNMDDFDPTHLSDIVNQKIPVKLSVIKNEPMARQMNQSILSQF